MRGSGSRERAWARTLSGLRDASYLRKWLVLGVIIGIVAGLGAIVFTFALRVATDFFLGVLAGYTPAAPIGEGFSTGSAQFDRAWAIPLVVGLGGLLSGILVFRFAPEAEGHGTDAAISAVHHNALGVRGRASLVKIVASAITIGSGGSGGREGPTAQISAGFGSYLSRRLRLTPTDARIAVAVGIGAGIGAIFRAPLGGAVLGAEILYRDDFEVEALIPSFIASIAGFAVFGAVEGFTPIFGFLRGYHFSHPLELPYFAGLGIAAGLVGILYSKSFYGVVRLTRRLPGSRMFKPAVAGVLVGLIGLVFPGVLGTGYGWVQKGMGPALLTLPLWIVLLLPFAKIAATSLSIGSGGSGGLFGPGMVVGGFLGAAAWRLLEGAPGVPDNPAPFVIVGMIALFGSISHAPLAVMLMVAEMTGSLELLAPAMIAIGLAMVVVGDRTIYTSQLHTRSDSPAYRFKFGLPLLASVPVAEAMSEPRLILTSDTSVEAARERLSDHDLEGAPVVTPDGVFKGSVHERGLLDIVGDRSVGELVDRGSPFTRDDSTLDAAMESMSLAPEGWIPVLDAGGQVTGIVSGADVIRGYRRALESTSRHLPVTPHGMTLIEEQVDEGSPVDGRRVAEIGWPDGTLLVTVHRGNQLLFPHGDTELHAGDGLSILAPSGASEALKLKLQAPREDPRADDEGPAEDVDDPGVGRGPEFI